MKTHLNQTKIASPSTPSYCIALASLAFSACVSSVDTSPFAPTPSSGTSEETPSTESSSSGGSGGSITTSGLNCNLHNYTTSGFVSIAGAHATYGINHATTSNRRADSPHSVWFQGKLWVAFSERNADGVQMIRVKAFDPATSTWTSAETSPVQELFPSKTVSNCSGVNVACRPGRRPKLIEYNSSLYLFWDEEVLFPSGGSTFTFQIRGAVFNGSLSAPAWTLIDGGTRQQDYSQDSFVSNGAEGGFNLDVSKYAKGVDAVVHDGSLFIAWTERNSNSTDSNPPQIRAMKYSGSGTSLSSWTRIDGGNSLTGIGGGSTLMSDFPTLVSMDGHLYVAFGIFDGGKGELLRYASGSTWNYVLSGGEGLGVNEVSPSAGYSPFTYSSISTAISGSKIYFGFFQDDGGNNYSKMRIQSLSPGGTSLTTSDGGGTAGLSIAQGDWIFANRNNQLLWLGGDTLVALWTEVSTSPAGSNPFRLRMKRTTDGGTTWSSFVDSGGTTSSLNKTPSASAMRMALTLDPSTCKIYYPFVQSTTTSTLNTEFALDTSGGSSIEVGVIE